MAIKYLAGNRLIGTVSGDTKPTLTAAVAGTTFLDYIQDLYRWDGDSWELVTGNTIAEDFQNKTFIDYCLVAERSAPGSSVGSGKGALYVDSSGVFWGKFENDSPVNLGEGAGATTLSGLTDVTISGDAAGHIIVRNAADNAYINVALSGVSGKVVATLTGAGALDIDELIDLADLDMTNANHTIFNNMAGKTLTIGASDTAIVTGQNLVVTGDLTVSGTTTTVNSTTLTVVDPIIFLSSGATSSASVDSGFVIERGSDTNVAFVWDENEDEFAAFATTDVGAVAGNIQTGTYQDMRVGGLTATTGAFAGVLSATSKILIDVADNTNVTAGADGHLIHVDAVSLNDNTTANSGTAAAFNLVNIEAPTITVANTGVTITKAATVYIGGAPADGDAQLTITDAYALYVAGGTSHFVGAVTAASTMTVTGNSTFAGTLGITGAVTAAAAMTVGAALGVTGVLTTTTHTAVGGNLTVTGTSVFTGAVTLPSGTTFAGNIAGGTATELTKLSVRDNAVAYDLEFQSATTGMNADRILIFNVNNVDRTVALAGNVTTAHDFITAGAYSLTLTTTATTNVTLPVTGTLATLAGDETLTTKTINSPKIGTALLDSAGDEMIKFTPSGGTTVNEFTFTNTVANGSPSIAVTGTDTHINLILKSKGTDGVIIASTVDNGAYIEFQQKAAPADMTGGAVEYARLYLKNIDNNNNALAVKIQKAGAVREVEITSPKAICGECGSKDGALDPTYDFSRSMMIVELWCGHSYEVPMNGWNMVS